MVQNKENDEESLVINYEIVEPEKLLVSIDKTIRILEQNGLKVEDVKELLINSLFSIRTTLLYIMGIMKIIGKNKVEKVVKDGNLDSYII